MNDPIVIVSGLPRSGTSMMMRMLAAGGMPLMTDAERPADADNPRGYFEFAPVKRLHDDASWMHQAHGKALKVVSLLLTALPPAFAYKVLFMERNLEEVLASQRAMLLRRVAQGEIDASHAAADRLDREDTRLRSLYTRHLQQVRAWMHANPSINVLYVHHQEVMADPEGTARDVAAFLKISLDEAAMAAAVEPQLHRQRAR